MSVASKTVAAELLNVKTRGPLGQASAIFSRFNVVDKDGDLTLPTAIADGTRAVVSPYNHSSVIGGNLPAGTATIRNDGDKAIADVQFFLTTDHGRNAFETVRALAEEGLGEWSYAFRVLDAEKGYGPNGEPVQYLKSLDVFEISPVLLGAGIRTETMSGSVKEQAEREDLRKIRRQFLSGSNGDNARAAAMAEQLRFLRTQFLIGAA